VVHPRRFSPSVHWAAIVESSRLARTQRLLDDPAIKSRAREPGTTEARCHIHVTHYRADVPIPRSNPSLEPVLPFNPRIKFHSSPLSI